MSARINDELAPTYEALKAERDAQQKRADALAVENAGFKHALSVILVHVDVTDKGDAGVAAMIANDALYNTETPATDAALAAIRHDAMAEGAEACVRALVTSDDDDFTDAPNICAMVAYQLREAK